MLYLSHMGYGTFAQVQAALERREMSVCELVQGFVSSSHQSRLGAYLTLCDERALAQARAADQLLAQTKTVPFDRFPLLGIPIAVKDLLTVTGVRTTAGSKILANYIPPYTATAVQRLEAAGAIVLGKTNLDEFGMGSTNENSAYEPVLHPTHSDRVPGGSSGGSAVAVKAELCLAALGTDTGGSIRLPASYCGVVGLKPSYGRVSRFGMIAYASSLDQIGPMGRSVEDLAVLLDVMSGYDERDATSMKLESTQSHPGLAQKMDWKQVRIGVPQEYFSGGLEKSVEHSVQQALQHLVKLGAQLVDVILPHTKYSVSVYYVIAMCEASSNLARYDGVRYGARPESLSKSLNGMTQNLTDFYKQVRSQFGAEVKRRILLGTFALSKGYSEAYYQRACRVRRKIKQDFDEVFKKVDFLVAPTSPTTALVRGEQQEPLKMYLNDIFTVPVNLAGLPALSLPCGVDDQGLSIGMQWIAPAFQEERLLAVAHAFERELNR